MIPETDWEAVTPSAQVHASALQEPELQPEERLHQPSEPPSLTPSLVKSTGQGLLFDDEFQPDWDSEDTYVPPRLDTLRAKSRTDLQAAFSEIRVNLYPRNDQLPDFCAHLLTEQRPSVIDLSKVAKRIATRLEYSTAEMNNAMAAATGHAQVIEQRTELVTQERSPDAKVSGLVRREELHIRAHHVLSTVAKLEDADIRQFVQILTSRVKADAEANGIAVLIPEDNRERTYRDMAHDLVRMKAEDIITLYHDAIAMEVSSHKTKRPLPDYMAFPSDLPLLPSSKSSFGVLPPSRKNDLPQVDSLLIREERQFLKHREYRLVDGSSVWVDGYNGTHAMYESENEFAKQLDDADFVLWWHRNSDQADYSVAVVRPDSHLNFWPDFVLCVRYFPEAEAKIRLADTKHDLKDAYKKSRREHKDYKKIIFLTKDDGNLFIVNDDGTKGTKVGSDLSVLRETLRKTDC